MTSMPAQAGPSTALPSLYKAMRTTLVLVGVAAVAILVIFTMKGGWKEGLASALIIGSIGILAEFQAVWRLRRALGRFAAALPPDASPFVGPAGAQGIRWPLLGVAVEGTVTSFGVRGLYIEAGGDVYQVPPRKAEAAGRDVAMRLGVTRRFSS